ncbi:MAG: hypothetical protein HS130_01680 [Deltaproteobacteria bacterium]|nr:hypothetical protein [Deltaproteobacteria bacterium]MCL4874847.1 hypothetical protein [bacterium]
MKNIISQLKSLATGGFSFRDEYLCKPEIALPRFEKALKEARAFYGKKDKKIPSELVHDCWKDNISRLESYFFNQMNADFVSNEIINSTMVFTDRKAHKIEVQNISSALDRNEIDRIVGKGLNAAFIQGKSRRAAAINSIHHLHHLLQFERATGRKISSIKSIVEFGGGYGNMARIAQNIGSFDRYSIIDLLLFSCIQYIFLCTSAGEGQVSFSGHPIKNAKFTLHPISDPGSMGSLQGELFLSTWALSESTRAIYDWVDACDWFGATNLLLAYNLQWKPWQENELAASLRNKGWRVAEETIPFLPGNFYFFATR